MKVTPQPDLSVPTPKPGPNGQAGVSANDRAPHGATASAAAQETETATASGVSVSVSQQTRSLSTAENTVAADVDLQKVARVKSAIQNGSYKVDAKAIADKLISSSNDFIQPTTH